MCKNNIFFKGVSVIVSVLFLINNISYGAPSIAQHMQKESTLKEMASALDGRTPAAIKDGLVIIKDGIRMEPRRRVVVTASGELKSSSAGLMDLIEATAVDFLQTGRADSLSDQLWQLKADFHSQPWPTNIEDIKKVIKKHNLYRILSVMGPFRTEWRHSSASLLLVEDEDFSKKIVIFDEQEGFYPQYLTLDRITDIAGFGELVSPHIKSVEPTLQGHYQAIFTKAGLLELKTSSAGQIKVGRYTIPISTKSEDYFIVGTLPEELSKVMVFLESLDDTHKGKALIPGYRLNLKGLRRLDLRSINLAGRIADNTTTESLLKMLDLKTLTYLGWTDKGLTRNSRIYAIKETAKIGAWWILVTRKNSQTEALREVDGARSLYANRIGRVDGIPPFAKSSSSGHDIKQVVTDAVNAMIRERFIGIEQPIIIVDTAPIDAIVKLASERLRHYEARKTFIDTIVKYIGLGVNTNRVFAVNYNVGNPKRIPPFSDKNWQFVSPKEWPEYSEKLYEQCGNNIERPFPESNIELLPEPGRGRYIAWVVPDVLLNRVRLILPNRVLINDTISGAKSMERSLVKTSSAGDVNQDDLELGKTMVTRWGNMPLELIAKMKGSNRNWYLGINSSTQSVTFTVCDFDTKEIIFQWQEKYKDEFYKDFNASDGSLPHPDKNRHHTNPLMLATALDKGMKELSDAFKTFEWDIKNIRAISGAGQQHGTVYYNKEAAGILNSLDPARPLAEQIKEALAWEEAPIWRDKTTESQQIEAEEFFGGPEALRQKTGSRGELRFGLLQIMKLYEDDKATYDKTATIVNIAGFNGGLLSGVARFPFDYGDGAGANAMDIRTNQWLPEIDELVPDLRTKLPDIKPTNHIVGNISRYWTKYGFSPDVKIVNWTGDNPSAMVGQGIIGKGQVGISLGTSFTIYTYIDEAELEKTLQSNIGNVFKEPTGKWMKLVCFQNGALALEEIRDKWVSRVEAILWLEAQGIYRLQFANKDDWEKRIDSMRWQIFNERVLEAPVGNGGAMMITQDTQEEVVRIPYIEGKPFTRNLDLETADRFKTLRAAAEGQVYFLKWIADQIGLDVKEINLTGGSSKNPVIRQIIADIFNAKVNVLKKSYFPNEPVSLGAAINAAKAYTDSVKEEAIPWEQAIKDLVALDSKMTTSPNENNVAIYRRYYPEFDKLVKEAMASKSSSAGEGRMRASDYPDSLGTLREVLDIVNFLLDVQTIGSNVYPLTQAQALEKLYGLRESLKDGCDMLSLRHPARQALERAIRCLDDDAHEYLKGFSSLSMDIDLRKPFHKFDGLCAQLIKTRNILLTEINRLRGTTKSSSAGTVDIFGDGRMRLFTEDECAAVLKDSFLGYRGRLERELSRLWDLAKVFASGYLKQDIAWKDGNVATLISATKAYLKGTEEKVTFKSFDIDTLRYAGTVEIGKDGKDKEVVMILAIDAFPLVNNISFALMFRCKKEEARLTDITPVDLSRAKDKVPSLLKENTALVANIGETKFSSKNIGVVNDFITYYKGPRSLAELGVPAPVIKDLENLKEPSVIDGAASQLISSPNKTPLWEKCGLSNILSICRLPLEYTYSVPTILVLMKYEGKYWVFLAKKITKTQAPFLERIEVNDYLVTDIDLDVFGRDLAENWNKYHADDLQTPKDPHEQFYKQPKSTFLKDAAHWSGFFGSLYTAHITGSDLSDGIPVKSSSAGVSIEEFAKVKPVKDVRDLIGIMMVEEGAKQLTALQQQISRLDNITLESLNKLIEANSKEWNRIVPAIGIFPYKDKNLFLLAADAGYYLKDDEFVYYDLIAVSAEKNPTYYAVDVKLKSEPVFEAIVAQAADSGLLAAEFISAYNQKLSKETKRLAVTVDLEREQPPVTIYARSDIYANMMEQNEPELWQELEKVDHTIIKNKLYYRSGIICAVKGSVDEKGGLDLDILDKATFIDIGEWKRIPQRRVIVGTILRDLFSIKTKDGNREFILTAGHNIPDISQLEAIGESISPPYISYVGVVKSIKSSSAGDVMSKEEIIDQLRQAQQGFIPEKYRAEVAILLAILGTSFDTLAIQKAKDRAKELLGSKFTVPALDDEKFALIDQLRQVQQGFIPEKYRTEVAILLAILGTSFDTLAIQKAKDRAKELLGSEFGRLEVISKSSSAGKAMMELNKELRNAENILLDKLIAEIAQAPGETQLLNDSLLTESLQALTELNTKATRLRGEQAIAADEEELIQLKIKAQRSVIEFARICAPIARIESEATIIVDPSVIPDERQRAAVVSILKDNRLRSALEYALSFKDKGQVTKKTQIVLLEDAGRISLDREKAILISDGQKLEDIKLFRVGVAKDKEDMLLPMAELIAIARGLLSLNNENFNQLFPAIKKMYEQYTGGNAINAEVEKRLREGTWSIFELIITTLPGVEKLNQQEIERLQRQALAALIAA